MSESSRLNTALPTNIYTIQSTLSGHTGPITALAWSPEGNYLSSSSLDGTICFWDGKTGALLHTRSGLTTPTWNMVWSPNEQYLALGNLNGIIYLWERKTGALLQILHAHTSAVWSLVWSYDGKFLASGSLDHTIHIWNTQTGSLLHTLLGHTDAVMTVAWSPDGEYLASGSLDHTVCLWNPQTGNLLEKFSLENDPIKSVTWDSNGRMLTALSLKNAVRRWDIETRAVQIQEVAVNGDTTTFGWSKDGQVVAFNSSDNAISLLNLEKSFPISLEGHTGRVRHLFFSSDDQFFSAFTLSNLGQLQGTLYVWRKNINDWILESTVGNIPNESYVALHPYMKAVAIAHEDAHDILLWKRDETTHSIDTILADTVQYRNAKVVLVGDTGVGKTGLALVLTKKQYEKTDSTHGRKVWTLYEDKLYRDDQCIEIREILLWDLAGQPGYRLIHQLYLDRVTIALVIFDARSDTNPFNGVVYWERALRQAFNTYSISAVVPSLKKFLIEARVDRGGSGISTERMNALMAQYGFDAHFQTSAKENIQIDTLRVAIEEAIDWEELPSVSSTRLIQAIKDFLVGQKKAGRLLNTIDALYQTFLIAKDISIEGDDLYLHFEQCIDRLEPAGVIKRLSFGNLVLLQPEILDAYASALIIAVREEPEGYGSITEERVRKGDFFMNKEERLTNKEQEKLLLIALIEDLLHRELVLREEPFLVFPSQSTREYPDIPEPRQKSIIFTFDGPILNIYVTLSVRLAHSGMFKRNELWKNAVVYTATVGGKCGILLHMNDEGHGEFTLFFDNTANEQTRFLFEEYVYNHLRSKVSKQTLKRRRNFFCDTCGTPITEDAVQKRIARGYNWIGCNVCDDATSKISLLDKERRIGMSSSLIQVLDHTADRQRDQETIKSSLEGKRASNSFDVFLWCSYEDKPSIKNYGRLLKEQGFLPWFEDWEIQPGLNRQREIEKYLKHAKSAAVFFGKGGVKAWVRLLEQAFVREFVEFDRPLIPVILPEAIEITLPDLPSTFQGIQWVDFRQEDPDPFKLLLYGITGKRPDI